MTDNADDRGWIARVEGLRDEGLIDGDQEATLIRHLDERRTGLEESMKALVPEYRRKLDADGKPAADEWAAAQARALGEADARATRELLEGMGIELP